MKLKGISMMDWGMRNCESIKCDSVILIKLKCISMMDWGMRNCESIKCDSVILNSITFIV
jgi:hypothetical protein